MSLRFACATLAFSSLLLAACGSSAPPKGPVVATGGASETPPAVADDATWMTRATHGARMRIPNGWQYVQQGGALVAHPQDKRAAIVLLGADSKAELETKVRALGAQYKIEKVDFGKPKPGNLHGIDVVMYEDMVAVSEGAPADVFVLLGEAPKGTGVVIVFVMAWDATQAHDPAIIEAANTLRPI
jgi:hypothetical protein